MSPVLILAAVVVSALVIQAVLETLLSGPGPFGR
jgi:hypothetical protein